MTNYMKVMGLITARGGSKGIPNKNITLLNGIPLISYTIEAALQSNVLDKIYVSTNDKKIASVAMEYGAEIINRPDELATDQSNSLDAIRHALHQTRDQSFTHFILLQPTSPLRNHNHISSALELFCIKKSKSLVSVIETEHSPFKTLVAKENNIQPLLDWHYKRRY